MIPIILFNRAPQRNGGEVLRRRWRAAVLPLVGIVPISGMPIGGAPGAAPSAAADVPSAPTAAEAVTGTASCLESGDGYLRARVAGAIEANIDWPNSGTRCQGESRSKPPGVRLSFRREPPGSRDLLFVFGLSGIREGKPARATGANLTIILQGTDRIFGTLGDTRCTVDSLTQKPLETRGTYRVEARGFCTQPAHAVRGEGAVLVSTFEFAGPVSYRSDPGAAAETDTAEGPHGQD